MKDLMVANKQAWNIFLLTFIVINCCGNSLKVIFIVVLSDRQAQQHVLFQNQQSGRYVEW